MRELRIEGLTERQCVLLDMIYSCDSYDELMNWTAGLPKKTQMDVLTLTQLLLHETIEQEMVEPLTSYPDAEYIINKIKSEM